MVADLGTGHLFQAHRARDDFIIRFFGLNLCVRAIEILHQLVVIVEKFIDHRSIQKRIIDRRQFFVCQIVVIIVVNEHNFIHLIVRERIAVLSTSTRSISSNMPSESSESSIVSISVLGVVLCPRSPTCVSYCSGNVKIRSCMSALRAAIITSASGAPTRPYWMLYLIVLLKRTVSCGTTPIA
uniref:Uncharacterized protein n=1 Tax=Anopheles dirus TaxID=7168 RepID=A0A182NWY9_9DIPT